MQAKPVILHSFRFSMKKNTEIDNNLLISTNNFKTTGKECTLCNFVHIEIRVSNYLLFGKPFKQIITHEESMHRRSVPNNLYLICTQAEHSCENNVMIWS